MQDIAENLNGLKGVKAACLFVDEDNYASTFSEEKIEGVIATADMVSEYFSAIDSVEKEYHELFFSLPDSYFVAFFVGEEMPLVFLLIEKKINLPLINMGVKAAIVKLKKQQEEDEPESVIASEIETDDTEDAVINTQALANMEAQAQELTSTGGEASIDDKATEPTSLSDTQMPDASTAKQKEVLQGTQPLVSIVAADSKEPATANNQASKATHESSADDEKRRATNNRAQKARPDTPERDVLKKPTLKYSGDNIATSSAVKVEVSEPKPEKKRSLFSWGRKKKKEQPAKASPDAAAASAGSSDTVIQVTSSEGINALQKELSDELINYLGPAASFVFQDVVEKWQETYLQKTSNLGYLVDMLTEELDADDEKQSYREAARKILS